MAGTSQEGGDDALITAINVTPLVDVVLVLLIILMVTATAIVSKTIPMDVPEAATGEQTEVPLAVSIDDSGQLYLDQEPLSRDALRARVRSRRAETPTLRALIAADGRIEHAKVVDVIDLLRSEQVTRFAIHVKPRQEGP